MNIYLQQERDIRMDIRRGDTIHAHPSPDQHPPEYIPGLLDPGPSVAETATCPLLAFPPSGGLIGITHS